MADVEFVELGRIGYRAALDIQEERHRQVAAGSLPETVYLLEHPHVLTTGRRADPDNHLASLGPDGDQVDLIRSGRGGDITYHGPGQLVGYPILDLRPRGNDLHRYLRSLEESLMGAACAVGVEAFRRNGYTGVWTSQGKLASIGIRVRRWTTLHGFALNVSTDLRYFNLIRPCGIPDCPMVSLAQLLERPISISEVIPILKKHLSATLAREDGKTYPSRSPAALAVKTRASSGR